MDSFDRELARRLEEEEEEAFSLYCSSCGDYVGDVRDYVDEDGDVLVPDPLLCDQCDMLDDLEDE